VDLPASERRAKKAEKIYSAERLEPKVGRRASGGPAARKLIFRHTILD
jgi:hypothetical protein